jgi:hypothetical protein
MATAVSRFTGVRAISLATSLAISLAGSGCEKKQPALHHYYDQHIQPVFDQFCVGNTSPCHRIDPATGAALGNLNLASFEGVQKRRDVLRNYGAYPQPLLLAKAIPDAALVIRYGGRLLPGEIRHAGGKTLAPSSDAFFELKRWIDNGATLDGQSPVYEKNIGEGKCNPNVNGDIDLGPTGVIDRNAPAYQRFVKDVNPVLMESCAFSTCHGSPQADFQLNCADTDAGRDANFYRATAFVTRAPAVVEESELLLRPLSPRAGGLSHTGGTYFPTREDEGWKALRDWAALLQNEPSAAPARSPGERFFGENVMPVLLRRGCALEGCHSPNGFNDFRLRPGSVGFLSPLALRRDYEAALFEFISLDTPDVRQSRLVRKNLLVGKGGITHRGGALFEDARPAPGAECPTPFDPTTASAFCTIAQWHRLERADRAGLVSTLAAQEVVPLAFVARPANPDGPLEFDTFRGGADLKLADAHVVGTQGHIDHVDNVRSALTACPELEGHADLDVRGPDWHPDGSKLVFAARLGDAGGLDLYELTVQAGTPGACRRLTNSGGQRVQGVRVHNFDPAYAPDGTIVFASTRAGTVTPKRFLPNANLFRANGGDANNAEQMTYLSGSELAPAFMQNGQMTFTAEKATPDFYQLSGRRLNWDLTDYHPLLAQRARSDDRAGGEAPSIGYQQATEIREGLDRNFLLILSNADAKGGGGALAVFNRSVGPFQEDRTEVTFLRSVHLADPAATGRDGTVGVYRSPAPLPDGEILASYATSTRPAQDVPRYDLVALGEAGARRMLVAGGDQSLVEATLGVRRSSRLLYRNSPQLVFGGHSTGDGDANVHFPDLPMLGTLLGANLRRGRNLGALEQTRFLAVYLDGAPPSAAPDPATLMGSEKVFTQRQLLGTAPLESDGSLRVTLPSRKPLILELQDGNHNPLFTMAEEHQLGPGEIISPGVPRQLFNGVCAGCHGSRSGLEPDIAVTPDALTGATVSLSRNSAPRSLQ